MIGLETVVVTPKRRRFIHLGANALYERSNESFKTTWANLWEEYVGGVPRDATRRYKVTKWEKQNIERAMQEGERVSREMKDNEGSF